MALELAKRPNPVGPSYTTVALRVVGAWRLKL